MKKNLCFVPESLKVFRDEDGHKIAIFEVVVKCLEGRFLYLQTAYVTQLVLGAIARAQAKHGFRLYAFVYMSSHAHILLGIRDATQLANSKRAINGWISDELGRPENLDRQGPLVERKAKDIPVLCEAGLEKCMRYIHENPVKANLVRKPQEYLGASSCRSLCRGERLVGIYIERTDFAEVSSRARGERQRLVRAAKRTGKWNRVRRFTMPTLRDVTVREEVKISKMPHLAHMSDTDYARYIRNMCAGITEEHDKRRAIDKSEVLGMDRLRKLDPHFKPPKKKRPRLKGALARGGSKGEREAYFAAREKFIEEYRLANQRAKDDKLPEVRYPDGGLPPLWSMGSRSEADMIRSSMVHAKGAARRRIGARAPLD